MRSVEANNLRAESFIHRIPESTRSQFDGNNRSTQQANLENIQCLSMDILRTHINGTSHANLAQTVAVVCRVGLLPSRQ